MSFYGRISGLKAIPSGYYFPFDYLYLPETTVIFAGFLVIYFSYL